MRGPNLIGLGKRPALTPSHQVDLPTGIGPLGAMMDGSRTKPVCGSSNASAEGSPAEVGSVEDVLAILVPRSMISDEDGLP